jgi:uncharacterized membrane protein YphA (DoxX/SURF4 family)
VLVGHVAVGLLARSKRPELSAGTYVFAAVAADLLAFAFILAGIERIEFLDGRGAGRYFHPLEISFSHSLATNLAWGAALAVALLAIGRPRRAALIAGLVVASHWVLDVISHPPDMPLSPDTPVRWGLGLWRSIPATIVIEGGLWLVALVVFVRGRGGLPRGRAIGLWIGAALITLVWIVNIAGPPPANPASAPLSSLIFFAMIVGWAYWIDPRAGRPPR